MQPSPIQIAPSILSCDFGHLAESVQHLEKSGADALHIDIMDGHFVPNLSMGPEIVSAIARNTKLFLQVHLMMYNPFDYIERFIASGADMIIFHFEATEDVEDCLAFIRRCGKKAGLCFNPETSFSMVPKFLNLCDLILFMAVNPGFGGQEFMLKTLKKIEKTRQLCDQLQIRQGGHVIDPTDKNTQNLAPFDIQVDGGINFETAKLCIKAGANNLVSGNYLFSQPDMAVAIESLRNG